MMRKEIKKKKKKKKIWRKARGLDILFLRDNDG